MLTKVLLGWRHANILISYRKCPKRFCILRLLSLPEHFELRCDAHQYVCLEYSVSVLLGTGNQ